MPETNSAADEAAAGRSHDLPTLVFVTRRQCGTCRRMESLVAWIEVTNKKRLRVVDLDTDRSPELARHLGVHVTPALVLLRDGEVLGRLDGRSTGAQIEALLGLISERS